MLDLTILCMVQGRDAMDYLDLTKNQMGAQSSRAQVGMLQRVGTRLLGLEHRILESY